MRRLLICAAALAALGSALTGCGTIGDRPGFAPGAVGALWQPGVAPASAAIVDPMYRRQIVVAPAGYTAGTIVIDPARRFLFLVQDDGTAIRYGVGVGREGFLWHGSARIARKAEWPGWTPPPDMLKRQPELPRHMAGGPGNPLGARAMYLYEGGRDTMYRIHGTSEPSTIGQAVSSGCIRLANDDVIDLYSRVGVGTHVVVL